ncbi:MAG: hypothetical protein HY917_00820 [Candidatus Diapherotrites archaeon]|nr:hypothetical protein [Candidatus Diapherotrites archaeon]
MKWMIGLVGLMVLFGCTGTNPNDTSLSKDVAPTSIQTFQSVNAQVCKENGKPIIRMYSTTWCPHCKWVKPGFISTVNEYVQQGKIVAYLWELDTGDNPLTPNVVEDGVPLAERAVYSGYNHQGTVPTFVFGCKYYRIGNGYEGQKNSEELRQEIGEFKAVIEELLKT